MTRTTRTLGLQDWHLSSAAEADWVDESLVRVMNRMVPSQRRAPTYSGQCRLVRRLVPPGFCGAASTGSWPPPPPRLRYMRPSAAPYPCGQEPRGPIPCGDPSAVDVDSAWTRCGWPQGYPQRVRDPTSPVPCLPGPSESIGHSHHPSHRI